MGTQKHKVSQILLVANEIISTNVKVPSPEELRKHGASPIVTRWWRRVHSSTSLNTHRIIRSFFEKFRILVPVYFIMMSIFNDNIFCSETDYFTNVSLTFSEAKLLLDNSFYVSSEIERITEYEKGFPGLFFLRLVLWSNFFCHWFITARNNYFIWHCLLHQLFMKVFIRRSCSEKRWQ